MENLKAKYLLEGALPYVSLYFEKLWFLVLRLPTSK